MRIVVFLRRLKHKATRSPSGTPRIWTFALRKGVRGDYLIRGRKSLFLILYFPEQVRAPSTTTWRLSGIWSVWACWLSTAQKQLRGHETNCIPYSYSFTTDFPPPKRRWRSSRWTLSS